MMTIEIWQFVVFLLLVLVVTAVATFFITRKVFSNYMKKHPPITEVQVREMMKQMGRTPSEKQVREVMRSFKQN